MATRIAVVVPNWLGDAVMAMPAVAEIRAGRPGDVLIAVGRASTVALFSMMPGIDEVARLDSRGGAAGALAWAEDAASLRSSRAEVAILLPNSFRSAWVASRAGIAERWGYAADLRGWFLTRRVPRPRGRRSHHAEYYLRLVDALGVSSRAASPLGAPRETDAAPGATSSSSRPLPVVPRIEPPSEARQRAADLLDRLRVPPEAPLVGLAPGAAYGKAKQWPPDHFARLAAELNRRLGAVCLVVGAPADAKVAAVVLRRAAEMGAQPPAVVGLAGQTDLPLLAALMARCRAFVSNDSGAMHMAAAAGLPVTAVFGASDERWTAPLMSATPGAPPHEILTARVWCRPCMLRECPIDHRCMRRVGPERAADAVQRQISGTPGAPARQARAD